MDDLVEQLNAAAEVRSLYADAIGSVINAERFWQFDNSSAQNFLNRYFRYKSVVKKVKKSVTIMHKKDYNFAPTNFYYGK